MCEDVSIKSQKMIRCVPTRWNTVASLVMRAITLRPALDSLVASEDKLRKLILSEDEWTLLEQLEPLLKVSRVASLLLSLV